MNSTKAMFTRTFEAIVKTHGLSALIRDETLILFFAAYNPDAVGEQLLLTAFTKAKGPRKLKDALAKDYTFQHQKAYMDVVSTMCVEFYIAEPAANMVCEAYVDALGGDINRIKDGIRNDVDIDDIFNIFNR